MMQFSVYIRHCGSYESMDVHVKRVKSLIPKYGAVSILSVTDKQYSNIYNFRGVPKNQKLKKEIKHISEPIQLELFSIFALEIDLHFRFFYLSNGLESLYLRAI